MNFKKLQTQKNVYLYAGDMPESRRKIVPFIGLSLTRSNSTHIKHDINNTMDLKDGCVDIYQSEDVMEHIQYNNLPTIINEIYRVLKPGGLFRLSMPDYKCDILRLRSLKDIDGNIVFDSGGGGKYDHITHTVKNGGHVWFPTFELVNELLQKTRFQNDKITFLHYYNAESISICKTIDYSKGFISRTPDHDKRVSSPKRAMSIVIDCIK